MAAIVGALGSAQNSVKIRSFYSSVVRPLACGRAVLPVCPVKKYRSFMSGIQKLGCLKILLVLDFFGSIENLLLKDFTFHIQSDLLLLIILFLLRCST